MILTGSNASNNPWHLDNLWGNFRMFHTGKEYLRMTTTGNLGIGIGNPGARFGIKSNPGQTEAFTRFEVSDAPGDYFGINNATGVAGRFSPSIIGHSQTYTNAGLYLIGSTSEEKDINSSQAVMIFDARRNNGAIQTRQLFGWQSYGARKMTLLANGNLGIGTATPTAKLEVSTGNSGKAIVKIESDKDNNNENDNPLLQFRQDGGIVGVDLGFSTENFGDNIFGIGTKYPGKDSNNRFNINTINGNVGIGTFNTGAYKLSVAGKVRATEVKVYTNWADYVFADDYQLPTLAEVAQHIEEKGHLINIPSAVEVAENGIQLGEMNAKLLEKIEELTLYTLEQEKKLQKMDVLEAQNAALEARLAKIELLLQEK